MVVEAEPYGSARMIVDATASYAPQLIFADDFYWLLTTSLRMSVVVDDEPYGLLYFVALSGHSSSSCNLGHTCGTNGSMWLKLIWYLAH